MWRNRRGPTGKGDLSPAASLQSAINEILRQGLEQMGLATFVDQKACERLLIYIKELKKWNRKINLIARHADDRQIVENHFLDSLTLLPYFQAWSANGTGPSKAALLDIGTGAGFPGLVLKSAYPDLGVTLVEPRQKRVSFLKHIIRTLQLDQVKVVHCRIDDGGQNYPDQLEPASYDLITSRALTDIATFLEMAAPFCVPAGRVICMKGPQGLEEAKDMQKEGSRGGLSLLEIREWQLPFSGARRYLLCFGVKSAAG